LSNGVSSGFTVTTKTITSIRPNIRLKKETSKNLSSLSVLIPRGTRGAKYVRPTRMVLKFELRIRARANITRKIKKLI
jgi:hypothetical protein